MAGFDSVIKDIGNGKHVRRDEWGYGSTMYANEDGQLMRTPTQYPHLIGSDKPQNGQHYPWTLDLNDINATDWAIA